MSEFLFQQPGMSHQKWVIMILKKKTHFKLLKMLKKRRGMKLQLIVAIQATAPQLKTHNFIQEIMLTSFQEKIELLYRFIHQLLGRHWNKTVMIVMHTNFSSKHAKTV